VICLLIRAERTRGELSKEFESNAQTIRNWVAQAEHDEGTRQDGMTSVEHEFERRSSVHYADHRPRQVAAEGSASRSARSPRRGNRHR
jgi:transposase-like protein